MLLSRYLGHAWTPVTSQQTRHPHSSHLWQAPTQSWALSREGPTCLAQSQPWGKSDRVTTKAGASDRSQTTEDGRRAKGEGPPLVTREGT